MKKLLSLPKRICQKNCNSYKSLSKKKKLLVILVGLLILVGLVFGAFQLFKTDKKPEPPKSSTITYSTDTPDENKPGKDFKWNGAPTDPKYITLPTIKGGGFIQNVGVDQKKAVAVPNNIYMAGWFVDTVKPGEKGLSVLDGHVNGRVNSGIFKDLIKLKKGDQFNVEFGNGVVKNFAVQKIVSVKTSKAASVLFSQEPGITNQLNLITCGGTFNRMIGQYEERVIVISKTL